MTTRGEREGRGGTNHLHAQEFPLPRTEPRLLHLVVEGRERERELRRIKRNHRLGKGAIEWWARTYVRGKAGQRVSGQAWQVGG
jgi:hypothetical protein